MNVASIFRDLEHRIWRKKAIPVKVSTLAAFLWCPRRSYIAFILENSCDVLEPEYVNVLLTPRGYEFVLGLLIHGSSYGACVEELRLSSENPEDVYELAKQGYAIPREVEVCGRVFQIQGAVDEIWYESGGYVIREIKTTKYRSLNKIERGLKEARFQVRAYGWILSRYLPIKKLELIYVNQLTKEIVHREEVLLRVESIETEIRRILKSFVSRQLPLPEEWVCRLCKRKRPRIAELCKTIFT